MAAPLELEAFCHREYGTLVRALRLYCGEDDLARDLAQDALAKACAQWRKVRRMENPSGWLYRVAVNLANSYFRRKKVEARAVGSAGAAMMGAASGPDIATAQVVRRAVAELPRRQRLVLTYRYFLDLSVAETADLMDCSEQTVKNQTVKAIAALRAKAPAMDWGEVRDGG